MNIPIHRHVLANGLRVIIHPDPAIPIVCVNIAYHVGSKDEAPGRTGFAHLFEHLMFNGSVNVPRGEFDMHCEHVGGYNNAYTTEDKTNYYMVVPSHCLELALWLESDRLLGLDITQEGLDIQRNVVLEEKRQRVDNQPYGSAETHIAELSYLTHPYHHPVIGYMEDIEAATLDDVLEFHRAYYRPDNAVLVIAGDVDPAEAIALATKYFGDIPSHDAPRRDYPREPHPVAQTYREIPDDIPLPAIFLAYRICDERHEDFVALDCMSELLGNGETSRLYASLVYELQLASQVQVFVENREHPGLLLMYAVANPGVSGQHLLMAMDEELDLLRTHPPDAAEVEKVMNRIESQFFFGAQALHNRADRLAHYDMFYGDPGRINTALDEYRRVTALDLARVAGSYLIPEHRVALHYVPRAPAAETGA